MANQRKSYIEGKLNRPAACVACEEKIPANTDCFISPNKNPLCTPCMHSYKTEGVSCLYEISRRKKTNRY